MEELVDTIAAARSGIERGDGMGEDENKKSVCVHHADMAADVREIKNLCRDMALRLERGDGRFEMLHQKLNACESRLDKIDQVFTKVLIAVMIAVIIGLGGMVFSGKLGSEGARHGESMGSAK